VWLEDRDTKKRLYSSEAKLEGGYVYLIRFPKQEKQSSISETQAGMYKTGI
jgi:hypothetical protein